MTTPDDPGRPPPRQAAPRAVGARARAWASAVRGAPPAVDDRPIRHLLADTPTGPEPARERAALELQRARRLTRTYGYGLTRPPRADPLFILCQPRTGSTLVFGLLNRMERTSVASEVLHRRLAIGPPPVPLRAVALAHLDLTLRARQGDLVGAKLHLEQMLAARVTVRDLTERWPRSRVLLLHRESLLEQYLSIVTAKRTGRWHARPGAEAASTDPVPVDVAELRAFCAVQHDLYARAVEDLAGHPAVSTLRYEDLAQDPPTVLAAALEPLGIALPTDLVPPTARQARGSVTDRLAEPDRIDPADPAWHLDPGQPARHRDAG